MKQTLIIGIALATIFLIGAMFASADTEVTETEEVKEPICGPGECGSGSGCEGSCGGSCKIKTCGCGK